MQGHSGPHRQGEVTQKLHAVMCLGSRNQQGKKGEQDLGTEEERTTKHLCHFEEFPLWFQQGPLLADIRFPPRSPYCFTYFLTMNPFYSNQFKWIPLPGNYKIKPKKEQHSYKKLTILGGIVNKQLNSVADMIQNWARQETQLSLQRPEEASSIQHYLN